MAKMAGANPIETKSESRNTPKTEYKDWVDLQ